MGTAFARHTQEVSFFPIRPVHVWMPCRNVARMLRYELIISQINWRNMPFAISSLWFIYTRQRGQETAKLYLKHSMPRCDKTWLSFTNRFQVNIDIRSCTSPIISIPLQTTDDKTHVLLALLLHIIKLITCQSLFVVIDSTGVCSFIIHIRGRGEHITSTLHQPECWSTVQQWLDFTGAQHWHFVKHVGVEYPPSCQWIVGKNSLHWEGNQL